VGEIVKRREKERQRKVEVEKKSEREREEKGESLDGSKKSLSEKSFVTRS